VDDCDDNDPNIHPMAGDTYGDGIDSDCDGLDCEAASDGHTYFAACDTTGSRSTLQQDCIVMGYDGLASIRSYSEDTFIWNLLNQVGGNFIFGYNDISSEGVWVWDDRSNFGYTNWLPGEPNNLQGSDCAYYHIPYSGQWDDGICTGTGYKPICQKR